MTLSIITAKFGRMRRDARMTILLVVALTGMLAYNFFESENSRMISRVFIIVELSGSNGTIDDSLWEGRYGDSRHTTVVVVWLNRTFSTAPWEISASLFGNRLTRQVYILNRNEQPVWHVTAVFQKRLSKGTLRASIVSYSGEIFSTQATDEPFGRVFISWIYPRLDNQSIES